MEQFINDCKLIIQQYEFIILCSHPDEYGGWFLEFYDYNHRYYTIELYNHDKLVIFECINGNNQLYNMMADDCIDFLHKKLTYE